MSGLAGSVHRDTVEIVGEHVVDIQRAVQKGDPVDAVERVIFQEEFGSGSAGRQLVDFAVDGVADVKRLVRSDREIVADTVVTRQVPTKLLGAGGEIKAPQGGMTLGRRCAWHRG